MGQLDARGSRDDVGVDAGADLGRQQGQQRAEPLATGVGEVGGCLGDERVVVVHLPAQGLVDIGETLLEALGQRLGDRGQREDGWGRAHRKNSEELSASSRTCAGKTPSRRVTPTPTVTAMVVSGDGIWATTSPPAGSVKYMSTMSRT